MRLLHLGDTHWSAKRLDEKVRCGNRILDFARELQPDLIVHAGDVFDAPIKMEDPGALEAVRWFAELRNIAPVLVNKGNESHDRSSVEILPLVAGEEQLHLSTEPEIVGWWPGSLTPMTLLEASQRDLSVYGALFCMMPYPSSSFLAATSRLGPEEMRQAVSRAIADVVRGYGALQVPHGIPKFFVFHGTVVGAQFSETVKELGMDIELTPFEIGAAGFDATLAGHLHFAQEIPTTSGTIRYPGGLACTHYGDSPVKGAWFYEVDLAPDGGSVAVKGRHLDVGARPMPIVEIDLSDPFFEPPAWAADAEADIQIRVKMQESDRERLTAMDWKSVFPKAQSVTIAPTVEQVESVRCESIRAAHSLREKLLAWDEHQAEKGGCNSIATPALLSKADMLESMDADAIIEAVKENAEAVPA